LTGPQWLVHEDELRLRFAYASADLVNLAATDEVSGVRPIPPCLNLAYDARSGRLRERPEFLDFVVETGSG
jgi:hypothetical protein